MTLTALEVERPSTITVEQAAGIMGINAQTLRLGLQRNQFDFGVAIQKKRWVYWINTERFMQYLSGGHK